MVRKDSTQYPEDKPKSNKASSIDNRPPTTNAEANYEEFMKQHKAISLAEQEIPEEKYLQDIDNIINNLTFSEEKFLQQKRGDVKRNDVQILEETVDVPSNHILTELGKKKQKELRDKKSAAEKKKQDENKKIKNKTKEAIEEYKALYGAITEASVWNLHCREFNRQIKEKFSLDEKFVSPLSEIELSDVYQMKDGETEINVAKIRQQYQNIAWSLERAQEHGFDKPEQHLKAVAEKIYNHFQSQLTIDKRQHTLLKELKKNYNISEPAPESSQEDTKIQEGLEQILETDTLKDFVNLPSEMKKKKAGKDRFEILGKATGLMIDLSALLAKAAVAVPIYGASAAQVTSAVAALTTIPPTLALAKNTAQAAADMLVYTTTKIVAKPFTRTGQYATSAIGDILDTPGMRRGDIIGVAVCSVAGAIYIPTLTMVGLVRGVTEASLNTAAILWRAPVAAIEKAKDFKYDSGEILHHLRRDHVDLFSPVDFHKHARKEITKAGSKIKEKVSVQIDKLRKAKHRKIYDKAHNVAKTQGKG